MMNKLDKPRPESFKVPYWDIIYYYDYWQDHRERKNPHRVITWRWSTPEEELLAWPPCAIPGCQNRSCLRLNSKYCHPHTLLMELKSYWETQ